MAFEILVGVDVIDDAGYATYRREMTPLLEAHGGHFVVDVRVAEVLRGPGAFNRLFTIRFPSADARTSFFALPEYLAIRERHFAPSVRATVPLAAYELEG